MAVKTIETSNTVNAARGDLCFGKFKKTNVILTSTIVVLVIAIISLILLLVTYGESNSCVTTTAPIEAVVPEEPKPMDPNVNVTSNTKLEVIPRRTWLAQPPTEQANKLHLPVPYVIIMHTASEPCKDHVDCIFAVRHIQSFHIESSGWWDIGFNFLIGGDGFAYEGRGWKSEGAHTYGYNSRSIGIAFVGVYYTVLPTQAQMTAAKQLIEQGVENGSIAKNYKLLAARQVSSTKSPGLTLYEEIKKWPHWAASP